MSEDDDESELERPMPRGIPLNKVLENRLRRVAERQGYKLCKSARRDRRAIDYGTWRLISLLPERSGFSGLTFQEVCQLLGDT